VRVLADAGPSGREMDLSTTTGVGDVVVHRDVVLLSAFWGNRSSTRHGTSPHSQDHRFDQATFDRPDSACVQGHRYAVGM
jgi:hypothetical protein